MSRLGAVRRVRELVVNRRLAELAAAERTAAEALAARRDARAARAEVRGPRGRLQPSDLAAARIGQLAAVEDIAEADRRSSDADRVVATARATWVAAAVDHRSVERIETRRAADRTREAARRAERQLDDLAIVRWQRS